MASNMNDRLLITVFFYLLMQTNRCSTTENVGITSENTTESPTTIDSTLTSIISATTCKVNSTCSTNGTNLNSTTTPTTTTTRVPATSPPPPTKPIKKMDKSDSGKNLNNGDVCLCNLQIDYCDLNCCCDQDCTSIDKTVFGYCTEEFRYYNTRFCDYIESIYINNSRHEWEVNQNGLFCVVKSNLPPTYTLQRKNVLKSFGEAEIEKQEEYHWPEVFITETKLDNVTKGFVYGEPLWAVYNNSFSHIYIPRNFVTQSCVTKEEIRYLIPTESHCIQTENNSALSVEAYRNLTVVAIPSGFNVTLFNSKGLKMCPKKVCLAAEVKICDNNFENCKILKNNFKEFKFQCLTLVKTKSCLNTVSKIRYIFHHNGTKGINKFELLLVLRNLTVNLAKDWGILQDFEVNFVWSNHSFNYSSHLSGNPGYLTGKPILIANLIKERLFNTNSTLTNLKLHRNPLDFSDNFMVLPENIQGVCALNSKQFITIEFGFNLYAKCSINDSIKNKNATARYLCKEMQRTIFNYWKLNVTNDTLSSRFIGKFGNANINIGDDWIPLLSKQDLNTTLNNTWGNFENGNRTLFCANISTVLILDIFYTRMDFDKILNQNKILGVTVKFGNYQNISFPYNRNNENFNFTLKIASQVMFYDITREKIRKIVDPPSLSIKLPYDFFYPFVKINSATNCIHPNFVVLTIISVVVISVAL